MQNKDEQIRQRAYQIWEHEGRPEGGHERHWHQASEEIGPDGGALPETAKAGSRAKAPARSAAKASGKTAPAGDGMPAQAAKAVATGARKDKASNTGDTAPSLAQPADGAPAGGKSAKKTPAGRLGPTTGGMNSDQQPGGTIPLGAQPGLADIGNEGAEAAMASRASKPKRESKATAGRQ